jgi:hypothetical protein
VNRMGAESDHETSPPRLRTDRRLRSDERQHAVGDQEHPRQHSDSEAHHADLQTVQRVAARPSHPRRGRSHRGTAVTCLNQDCPCCGPCSWSLTWPPYRRCTRPNFSRNATASTNTRRGDRAPPNVPAGQPRRKRRDSNPRVVAHRSLSATHTSAPIVHGVLAGQPTEAVPGDRQRSWANATGIAPGESPARGSLTGRAGTWNRRLGADTDHSPSGITPGWQAQRLSGHS